MKFGISTSSFQYEENSTNTQFSKENKKGVMHDKFWKKDLMLLKNLDIESYRFSIEWSKIEPQEGKYKETVIQKYKKHIEDLKKNNIEPVVCLFHFTVPKWFSEKGGFLKSPDDFTRFAMDMIQRFFPVVNTFVVMNEPNVYALCSYFLGRWGPKEENVFHFRKVTRNLQDCYNTIVDKLHYDVKLGFTVSIIPHYNETLLNSVFDGLYNESFLNRKLNQNTSFVGINYYFPRDISWMDMLKRNKKNFFEGNKNTSSNLGWPIDASKIKDTVEYVKNCVPDAKVWITENGLSTTDVKKQCEFIEDHVSEVAKIPSITRYYYWTLLDCWEWDFKHGAFFGLVSVDRKTFRRKPKQSYYTYRYLIQKYKE